MIKPDNALTQYKNIWAFGSMQQFADKCNATINRLRPLDMEKT